MGTVKVYEYMICKGKIIKLEHRAEEKGNAYWLKSGMTKSFKILRKNELGQVISNHVFSLDDNLKEYRQRIIACLEERVNETKSRLEKQEKMLAEVRNEV